MTVITSTASTATAYSNQRKIDRTSNGVLWAFPSPDTVTSEVTVPCYSTDNGATWTADTGVQNFTGVSGTTYIRNHSVFIDVDDYAHLVFKDDYNGYLYYCRGTPNAARTAWTWSAARLLRSVGDTRDDHPDVVAHRWGTGWAVHVVWGLHDAQFNPENYTMYARLGVASDGTLTLDQAGTGIGGSYGVNVPTYPSIDFHHTGDGKTVAGGTPHLYVAWSAGQTGTGKGIRFKKATYSGTPQSWTLTWGTDREIDSARYVSNDQYWLNCLFDGSRVLIAGELTDNTRAWDVIYSRDDGDTVTTQLALDNTYGINGERLYGGGSFTYDGSGNMFMFGRSVDSPSKLQFRKWDGTSLLPPVVLDTTIGAPYVSVKRGYSNNEIEFIYTDGTASPYNVTYGQVALVQNLTSSSSDGAALGAADSSSLLKQFSASDSSSISVSEVSSNFDSLPGSDASGLRISESSSVSVVVIPKSATDAGSVSVSENSSIVHALSSYDAGIMSAAEYSGLMVNATLSSSDSASVSVTETSDVSSLSILSASDSSSVSVADSATVQPIIPPKPVSTTIYEALRDKPVALFQMDNDSPFLDYSGYNHSGSMQAGVQVNSTALCAGCKKSTQFSSTNTGQFDSPVFVQGKESNSFSLEAWVFVVSDGTAGEQQILGHNGEMDGLTINGTVVSFVTKYLVNDECRVTYDLQVNRRAHIVGVHTDSKNVLYVDGVLVSEADLTEEQQGDSYVATDGKLYSGATTSTQKINVNVLGVYASPLSGESVARHFAIGNEHMTAGAVASQYGGMRIPLSFSVGDVFLTQTWETEGDWEYGLLTSVSVVDDQLVPWLEDGVSVAGTWQTAIPLDASGDTSVYGVNMTWDGEGAIVEASVDGGTTWETVVRGANLAGIPAGTDPTGMVLEIQVSFAGGIDDDPSYFSSLTVNGYRSATNSLFTQTAERSVTYAPPAHIMTDREPVEMRDDWGVDLNGATLTISPDTSTDPINPQTVEVWIKSNGSYSTDLVGTEYTNGDAAVSPVVGEWQVRTYVLAAPQTTDITFTGDVQIGQVVLYNDALTAQQISDIYNSYIGLPRVSVTDESTIVITKPAASSDVYAYDWAITASG